MQKKFHPKSYHNAAYDFDALINSHKPLQPFVQKNQYGNESIDFSNEQAVRTLNQALLKYFYSLDFWEIPKGYLCPPIPGRVDYIHYLADLLQASGCKNIKSSEIKGLDIGVGANGIYTLLANSVYAWQMIGSDIDEVAIKNVQQLICKNNLEKLEIRLQTNKRAIFDGIIKNNEFFDFTLCNPPFFKSKKEAVQSNIRKTSNLNKKQSKQAKFNFGGSHNELWCEGGEVRFINDMITQSKEYANNVLWFTTLVSKKESLPSIQKHIKQIKPALFKIIPMQQGHKITRFIAWSFLDKEAQKKWWHTKKI